MKVEEFVKKHIDTLEHFIEQGGWPLSMIKERDELLKLKAFTVNSSNSLTKTGKFNPRLLAAFYKLKYEEKCERYEDLVSKLETIMKEH